METLQERGASSGDCDLVAAEIKSLQKQNSKALALYEKVLDGVTDPQLLSHAYLVAARTALNMEDTTYAEKILERGCQALNQYQEADDILTELAQQYPLDYRFDMQRAYLLIDWQGTKPAEKLDRPALYKRMAQIRRERVCPRDSFFRDWNRWNDRFSCCGSLFGTNPAQAGEKAEGADLERVSIKSNRGV